MTTQNTSNHIREVQMIADGGKSVRDPIIKESWLRCVRDHGLDPTDLKEAYIVPNHELRQHRESLEQLIRTARYGLESLYRQISGQSYVLLLTDAQGVTVDYIGASSLDEDLRRAGLYLGSEWSEARAGTCGVGSCIHTGEALVVHQTDHFDGTHAGLTCTAAPIYDANGRMAAVLDISALHSPEFKDSQGMALHLVKAFSQRIEMANLMSTFRSDWVIRFSQSPEFLEVDPEYAVAVSPDGRIAGMTHGAQRLLANSAGLDWRTPEKIIGQKLETFFDLDANDLPLLTRARPTTERTIGTKQGSVLFAHSIAPQRTVAPSRFSAEAQKTFQHLHGGDPVISDLTEKVARLAHAPISILLNGETGTGKEYLARAIHEFRRVQGKFVAINCAAIPETLIESELFGYEPGSFTGAHAKGKKGLIEQADGGTLFLDEIGDMPLVLQARLLRVLAEKEVMRVGALKPIAVNARVVAATHQDLAGLVKSGKFREDLFYRLTGAVFELPPLRKRQDFDWLLEKLLNADIGRNGQPVQVSPRARAALKSYQWPGNIRQLLNTLEFAKALCSAGTIEISDLPDTVRQTIRPSRSLEHQPSSSPTSDLSSSDADLDDGELAALLKEHSWNVSEVARVLGVARTTLYRRMNNLGLLAPNRR
jgi:sigma-54 dependent transcriptional regulator, acetoin dehydrogenase operon transcriptional activator AcoR